MNNRDEMEIKSIEAAPGAVVARISKDAFGFKAIYVLEDGQRIETVLRARLMRDAKEELSSLPKAPKHPMKAIFHDGRLVGTETRFTLGGRS